jgi:peptide/nickel transport system permease protein
VRFGYAIFAVATLSFMGFGIQPPSPDWGVAVADSYGLISVGEWWPALFNALAIATLVIGVNLVAEGVQAAAEA